VQPRATGVVTHIRRATLGAIAAFVALASAAPAAAPAPPSPAHLRTVASGSLARATVPAAPPQAALAAGPLTPAAPAAISLLPPQAPAAGGSAPPTPVAVPQAELGPWTYRADPHDTGIREGWPARPPAMAPVSVPGVANPAPLAGPGGRRAFAGSVGWWRTTLSVAPAGRYAVSFGSVHHQATVWIDGVKTCEHTGAYAPFTCTAQLGAGQHTVMLRADWRSPERQDRAGFDRAWFNWGGLAWPVTAAPVADAELRLVAVHTTLKSNGTARLSFTIELHDTRDSGAPASVAVAGALTRAPATAIPVAFDPIVLAPGERRRVAAQIAVPAPALWQPGSPSLYDLTLSTGATALHEAVGLRELRRDGSHLLLNGHRLRLAGAGLPPDAKGHGDALTPADQDRLVDELRQIGANALRTQLPLSDAMLTRLDAAGILVWQQVGPFDKAGRFWARTPRRRAIAEQRAIATVDREAAHPSILAWNLANEIAGAGHPDGQARYVGRLAGVLHRRTPGVFVVADIWGSHLPHHPGTLFRRLDAIGMTEYIGIFEAAGAPTREQNARVRDRLRRLHAVLRGKPIVITELGANANGRNPTSRPGGLGYQAQLLTHRIGFYAQRPDVSGTLIWVLRDYAVAPDFRGGTLRGRVPGLKLSAPLNEKGLFRYSGSPKPAVAAVRAAYARTARPLPAGDTGDKGG
jgi:hypothetical protein